MTMRRLFLIFVCTLTLLGGSTFLLWHRDSGPIPEEASHAWAQAPSSTIELIPGGGTIPSGTAGGSLTGSYPNPTIAADTVGASQLTSTTVTPNTYGSATTSPVLIIDADGRITGASNVPITDTLGGPPSGPAGGSLAGNYPDPTLAANTVGASQLTSTTVTPATYGSATTSPVLIIDADGRVTGASNVNITATSEGEPAGGDLTGTYPNPTIATNAVGSAEVIDNSLTGLDIDESSLVFTDLIGTVAVVDNSLTGADITESSLILTDLIGPGELASTTVTPGTYGTTTSVPTLTVDQDGRVTTATQTAIAIGSAGVVDNSLTTSDILDNTLTGTDILDNTLTGTDINESTLVLTGLIGTAEVVDNALTGADIDESTLVLTGLISTPLGATTIRPLSCVASTEFIVNAATKCLEVCNAAGTGWEVQPGCSGGSLGSTTGIRVDVDSVTTLRYSVTTTSTSMTLDQHLILLVNTLGEDITISLPDPADPAKPGYYEIVINDEVAGGSLRVAPTAGATIGGISTPTEYIAGKGNYFVAMRLGNTAWRVVIVAPVSVGDVFLGANNTYATGTTQDFSASTVILSSLGSPVLSICSSVGGSTNTSSSGSGTWITHSLNCTIPAAKITTGTTIDVCVGLRLVTGSAPPLLTMRLLYNSTPIWQAAASSVLNLDVPGHTAQHCFSLKGASTPSATASLYTASGECQNCPISSIIGDPVIVDTLSAGILALQSFFDTAGTGTTSLEEMYFDVKGARFAN